MRADDERRLARRDTRARLPPGLRSRAAVDARRPPRPSPRASRASVASCCRASTSVGAMKADCHPLAAAARQAYAATTVLPDPTSPWSSRFIGTGAGEIAGELGDHPILRRRQGERKAREDAPVERGGESEPGADRLFALRLAPREEHLVDEELVEGEPAPRALGVLGRCAGSEGARSRPTASAGPPSRAPPPGADRRSPRRRAERRPDRPAHAGDGESRRGGVHGHETPAARMRLVVGGGRALDRRRLEPGPVARRGPPRRGAGRARRRPASARARAG